MENSFLVTFLKRFWKMIRQHKGLEQLDDNISFNSTFIDEQKPEVPTEPTLTERDVDFNKKLKDKKTKDEIANY